MQRNYFGHFNDDPKSDDVMQKERNDLEVFRLAFPPVLSPGLLPDAQVSHLKLQYEMENKFYTRLIGNKSALEPHYQIESILPHLLEYHDAGRHIPGFIVMVIDKTEDNDYKRLFFSDIFYGQKFPVHQSPTTWSIEIHSRWKRTLASYKSPTFYDEIRRAPIPSWRQGSDENVHQEASAPAVGEAEQLNVDQQASGLIDEIEPELETEQAENQTEIEPEQEEHVEEVPEQGNQGVQANDGGLGQDQDEQEEEEEQEIAAARPSERATGESPNKQTQLMDVVKNYDYHRMKELYALGLPVYRDENPPSVPEGIESIEIRFKIQMVSKGIQASTATDQVDQATYQDGIITTEEHSEIRNAELIETVPDMSTTATPSTEDVLQLHDEKMNPLLRAQAGFAIEAQRRNISTEVIEQRYNEQAAFESSIQTAEIIEASTQTATTEATRPENSLSSSTEAVLQRIANETPTTSKFTTDAVHQLVVSMFDRNVTSDQLEDQFRLCIEARRSEFEAVQQNADSVEIPSSIQKKTRVNMVPDEPREKRNRSREPQLTIEEIFPRPVIANVAPLVSPPAGPSKTMKQQRSLGIKLDRMISSASIKHKFEIVNDKPRRLVEFDEYRKIRIQRAEKRRMNDALKDLSSCKKRRGRPRKTINNEEQTLQESAQPSSSHSRNTSTTDSPSTNSGGHATPVFQFAPLSAYTSQAEYLPNKDPLPPPIVHSDTSSSISPSPPRVEKVDIRYVENNVAIATPNEPSSSSSYTEAASHVDGQMISIAELSSTPSSQMQEEQHDQDVGEQLSPFTMNNPLSPPPMLSVEPDTSEEIVASGIYPESLKLRFRPKSLPTSMIAEAEGDGCGHRRLYPPSVNKPIWNAKIFAKCKKPFFVHGSSFKPVTFNDKTSSSKGEKNTSRSPLPVNVETAASDRLIGKPVQVDTLLKAWPTPKKISPQYKIATPSTSKSPSEESQVSTSSARPVALSSTSKHLAEESQASTSSARPVALSSTSKHLSEESQASTSSARPVAPSSASTNLSEEPQASTSSAKPVAPSSASTNLSEDSQASTTSAASVTKKIYRLYSPNGGSNIFFTPPKTAWPGIIKSSDVRQSHAPGPSCSTSASVSISVARVALTSGEQYCVQKSHETSDLPETSRHVVFPNNESLEHQMKTREIKHKKEVTTQPNEPINDPIVNKRIQSILNNFIAERDKYEAGNKEPYVQMVSNPSGKGHRLVQYRTDNLPSTSQSVPFEHNADGEIEISDIDEEDEGNDANSDDDCDSFVDVED